MNSEYSTYPENINDNEDDPFYYVEFHKWSNQSKTQWTLYRRQFICSKEEWEKRKQESFQPIFMTREGHPWNLGGGVINEWEHAIDMNTKKFLTFLVDSLNKNVENDVKSPRENT